MFPITDAYDPVYPRFPHRKRISKGTIRFDNDGFSIEKQM